MKENKNIVNKLFLFIYTFKFIEFIGQEKKISIFSFLTTFHKQNITWKRRLLGVQVGIYIY